MASNKIQAIPMVVVDGATITSSYVSVNPNGLSESLSLMYITNDSTAPVYISFDGIHDNEYLRTGETKTFNFQTNSLPNGKVALLCTSTQIYMLTPTAGTGNIFISGYYS